MLEAQQFYTCYHWLFGENSTTTNNDSNFSQGQKVTKENEKVISPFANQKIISRFLSFSLLCRKENFFTEGLTLQNAWIFSSDVEPLKKVVGIGNNENCGRNHRKIASINLNLCKEQETFYAKKIKFSRRSRQQVFPFNNWLLLVVSIGWIVLHNRSFEVWKNIIHSFIFMQIKPTFTGFDSIIIGVECRTIAISFLL